MSKHTPGPWSILEHRRGDFLITSSIPSQDCTYTMIGSLGTEWDVKLTAAAPELLLACKIALTSCDPHAASYRYIEAAIAKAEGIRE